MSRRLKHGRIISDNKFFRRAASQQIDYVLLFIVLGLSAFGLLMVYDASVAVAISRHGERFYFVADQARNLGIGLVCLLLATRINYQVLRRFAPIILGIGILFLLAVLVPGLGVSQGGARSWLDIGPIIVQPSYPLTVALIIYLASWLTRDKPEQESWQNGLLPFLVLVGFILAVVAIPQGDLGTAILMASVCLIMYFLSGAPIRHLVVLLPIGAIAALALVIIQPYRIGRIMTLLQGNTSDSLDQGWQITQIMIALGSGGLTGLGLGQSRQKYEYIPVVESDSIFAVVGEELGFIGAVFVIGVMFYLVWRGLQLSKAAPDPFGRMLVVGIMSLIAVQALINLLGVSGIIPFTGIPLPFISSGGTSLIVLLSAMGIVLNVSRQANQTRTT